MAEAARRVALIVVGNDEHQAEREQIAAKVEQSTVTRREIYARQFRRHLSQAAGALDALSAARAVWDPRRHWATWLAWVLRRTREHADVAAAWTARS